MTINQTRSKRHWLWLVPGSLLVIGVVAIFAGWLYFKTTPSYSLALLVEAAQQNDQVAFDRVVDLDKVIDNFITQGSQDSSVGLTTAMVTSIRLPLQSMAPETAAIVKQSVRDEIGNRTNELSGSTGARPFLVTALAIPFVAEVTQSGDRVQVKIDRNGQVELFMERSAGSDWRVTALRDQELAGRVLNGIIKNLPGPGSPDELMPKQLRGLPGTIQKLPLLNGK